MFAKMLVFVALFVLFIATTNSSVEAQRRSAYSVGSYEHEGYNKKPSYNDKNEIYSPKKSYYSNNYPDEGYSPRKPYNNYADEGYALKKKDYTTKKYYDYGKNDYEPSSYGPKSYNDEGYNKKYDIVLEDGYNADNYPKKPNYIIRKFYEEPHRGYGKKPYGRNNYGYEKSGKHYGYSNNDGYGQRSHKTGAYANRRYYQNDEGYYGNPNNYGY